MRISSSARRAGAVAEALEARALLSAAAVDLSFGDGGVARTGIAWQDLAPAGDGFVVATRSAGLEVVRLTAGGTPDAAFGAGGRAAGDASEPAAQALAVAADGRVYVAGMAPLPAQGTASAGAGGWHPAITIVDNVVDQQATHVLVVVARYNADGTRDAGFDGDGKAEFVLGHPARVAGLVARAGGGVLVVTRGSGASYPLEPLDVTYTALDGAGGVAARSSELTGDFVWAVAAAPWGGSAVVALQAASQAEGPAAPMRFVLVNDAAGGAAAPRRFGAAFVPGRVRRGVWVAPGQSLGAVVVQPDGKILAAGTVSAPARRGVRQPQGWLAVARFDPSGAPDGSFGRGGVVLMKLPRGRSVSGTPGVYDLDVSPDGRVVVTTTMAVRRSAEPTNVLLHLRADGRPERAAGPRGAMLLPATPGVMGVVDVFVRDREYVVAGWDAQASDGRLALYRFTPRAARR